ncbi:hypothetical protein PIB30_026817 [Stylosanthes scabra]|uniref:Uncharacterized protein n=1 Tax=Stylosanthes scabra TaxID=79078 RepID=A0ABU6QA57_9FABA|nr:hypothetical protein [Stylosanthes scabra]
MVVNQACVVLRRFAEKEGEEKSVAESPRETRNVGVVAGTGVDSGGGDTTEGEKAGFESEGLMEAGPHGAGTSIPAPAPVYSWGPVPVPAGA